MVRPPDEVVTYVPLDTLQSAFARYVPSVLNSIVYFD
jgi:hypothetical protein